MDIRNWPVDRIMQLPDYCFGRRFMLSCVLNPDAGVQAWDIAEIAFPEKAEMWELAVEITGTFNSEDTYRLAIGHQLPTTQAQMDALDPIFQGMGLQGAEPRRNIPLQITSVIIRKLRMPIHAGGRRMITELTPAAGSLRTISVKIIISSMPTEVPEWLISGQGRGL